MLRLLLATAVALLPGLFAWWEGRRLHGRLESPLFPELWLRHRRRLGQAAALGAVGVVLLGGWQAVWLVPLLGLVLLAGAFPARRAVYGETWDVVGYLSWATRVFSVFGLFWVVVLSAPLLVDAAGPRRLGVTTLLAAVMAGTLLRPRRATLRLLGAVPLEAASVPGLAAGADAIVARSSAPRPVLYRLELAGGRWANALALPHPRQPAVAFSGPLLELLSPPEVAAILAHEVAHLEHMDRRFVRRTAVVGAVVAGASLAWAPLAAGLAPGWDSLLVLLWPLLVLVSVRRRLARHRERESDSDRRAVELGADPEALVSALVALHVAARLPRRLSADDERRMTHPSLARRAQAIRSLLAATPGEEPPAAALPAVVAGILGGEWVVVEPERVTWLEGVPAGTPADPDRLREAATGVRTLAYERLGELRVEAARGGPARLVAVEAGGRRTATPVEESGVVRLQAALDLVDTRLGPRAKPSLGSRLGLAGLVPRLVAALALLAALFGLSPVGGGAPAILALAAPRLPCLLAAGVASLAAAAMTLFRLPAGGPLLTLRLGGGAAAAVAGVVLLALGSRTAVLQPVERRRWLLWPSLTLLGVLAVSWCGVLLFSWVQGAGQVDPWSLHRAARSLPGLAVLPLAAAAALVPGRRGWRWAGAAAVALLAVPPLLLGSAGFRNRFAPDPLLATGSLPRPAQLVPEVVWTQQLGRRPWRLRLAPGGESFAVGEHLRDPAELGDGLAGPRLRWALWRGGGGEDGPVAEVLATDLAPLDRNRGLALVPAAQGDGLELRVVGGGAGAWSVPLPPLVQTQLEVDGTSWRVSGRECNGHELVGWVRCAGRVGAAEVEVSRWRLPDAPAYAAASWAALDGERAVAEVVQAPDEAEDPSLWSLFTRPQTTLTVVDRNGQVATLATTRLVTSCRAAAGRGGVCVACDGDAAYLWRAVIRDGKPALDPLGVVSAQFLTVVDATDSSALLDGSLDKPTLVDLVTGAARELELPAEARWGSLALAEPDLVAAVEQRDQRPTVVVYRLAR